MEQRHSDSGQTRARPKATISASADWTRIMPRFFDTIGALKLLAGRTITEDDNGNTQQVAVINEAFAKKFFGSQNPIGRHFGPAPVKNAWGLHEIVGVVRNINYENDPARVMYYIPEAQTVHFDQLDLYTDEPLVAEPLQHCDLGGPGIPRTFSCR